MAQSRLERIGTIFSRITLLMKGGALKPEDQPMWYVIYKAFPPKVEPRFDRAPPNIEIRDIWYKEDIIRGQFHNDNKKLFNNLIKDDEKSHTQKFISIYQELEKDNIPESELYQKALKMFKEQQPSFRNEQNEESSSNQFTKKSSASRTDKPKIKIEDLLQN